MYTQKTQDQDVSFQHKIDDCFLGPLAYKESAIYTLLSALQLIEAKEYIHKGGEVGANGDLIQAWVWGVRGWIPEHQLTHYDVRSKGPLSGSWDWGLMSEDRLECVRHAWHTWLGDLWRENRAFQHKWFAEPCDRCNVCPQKANGPSQTTV